MRDRTLVMVLVFPVIFFLILAGLVWVPRIWLNPEYDFVYSFDQGCDTFELKNTKIQEIDRCGGSLDQNKPDLYYYNVDSKDNEKIDLENANELSLLDQEKSPDGFVLKKDNNNSVFGGGSSNNLYLQGKGGSLSIDTPEEHKYGQLVFLGWVKK
ncbi:hypothetical protein HC864_02425 [Candidatus Gracilibacteria bacterium]|nr:hypothetical protein [Candidatus Gracilibacteria bacterium]